MNIRELSNRVHTGNSVVQDRLQGRIEQQPAGKLLWHARFDRSLKEAWQDLAPQQDVIRLSAHAEQRLAERHISLTAQERTNLGQAISTLHEKGAKNPLIVRQDAAFVVNVPSRTLVTAINQQELQQRVFTQIDSTMLI
jgi:flagellar operon protein